ncbi:TlpA family protein disulfide reductase [Chitinophaga filiformis]|uniref:Thiol-disulfide isomerase or thioredoxin n=1 Tax=Chitinophaga filiformis TaxID=104663 RepID=A0A1G8B5F7_CHIFI|nr:TlpA disulfide reductase family protein [Chitinophaga filiformis]SDH28408.1 Thiol-disulfide isomerase or thioredoxin [Chitinophaga filiformis]
MLKYFLLTGLLLSCALLLLAQEKEPFYSYEKTYTPLSIGAVVPDYKLLGVLNYRKTDLILSEFHGKALLIDFWAIFCQPCLAQFQKLQRIQEKYKKDLQVIAITNDSLEKVIDLFENIRYQGFNLLTVARTRDSKVNDSLFFAFPHKYIPHYIWIDKNRVVKAITGYEALNDDNIALLTGGGSLDAISNKDVHIASSEHPAMYAYQDIDITEKMMLNDSIKGLIGYSMLSGYNKKYPPSSAIDYAGIYAERRIRTWNLPLATMIRIAYGKLGREVWEQELVAVPRVFLSIRDTLLLHKLTVDFKQAPDTTADMYCYDLIIAGKGRKLLMEKMKEDLYRYFGVNARIVQRKVQCYILSLVDSSRLRTKGGDTYVSGNMYYLKLQNAEFSSLSEHIRTYNEGSKTTPYKGLESGIIVDETNFTSRIDVNIAARMNDIPSLNGELSKYGLALLAGERLIDVLLIED